MKQLLIHSIGMIFGVVFIVALPLTLFADGKETSIDAGDIVASDFAEMQEYAQAQYEHLLTKIEVANSLSDEHKKLVATALSKNLEGLPICTFNQEIVYAEESERSETRLVTVHDNGILTDDKGRERLFSEWKYSPFTAPSAAGMDFASATIIDETGTDVTFQFRFDKKAKSASENITELLRDLRRVARNLRYELKVDSQTGAPKSLVLELIKPTRVFVIARVKKIRYESVYRFDENLQRFVIPEQSVEYTASAPVRGTESEKIDVLHSNFECSTPIRYVWRASLD
ncbi:MAG: hypothetical protein F4X56_00985 [Gammaproteobacteria bacterium]|nr:hypothetical protein [Gammaproteobacteria bacterium]